MPAARYWRLVGVEPLAGGFSPAALEFWFNNSRVDGAAVMTESASPVGAPGHFVHWDFGSAADVDRVEAPGLNYADLQYSTDNVVWEQYYPLVAIPKPDLVVSGKIVENLYPLYCLAAATVNTSYTGSVAFVRNQTNGFNHQRLMYPFGINIAHTTGPTNGTPTLTHPFFPQGDYLVASFATNQPGVNYELQLEFLDAANNPVFALSTIYSTSGGIRFGESLANLTQTLTAQRGMVGFFTFSESQIVFTPTTTGTHFVSSSFTFVCAASTIRSVTHRTGYHWPNWFNNNDYTASYFRRAQPGFLLDTLPTFGLTSRISTANTTGTSTRGYAPAMVDFQRGGTHRVTGTTKTLGAPNQPVRRRVQLIDERSGLVFRETWSDAVTGEYTFSEISPQNKYSVVAYDHTGQFRAVIADNLSATP